MTQKAKSVRGKLCLQSRLSLYQLLIDRLVVNVNFSSILAIS